jgi:TolB-like protein/tetratricopeptide (TPR) repeat protein
MEKDAGRRYQTARELLSNLDKVEKGIPIDKAIPIKKKVKINWKRVSIYGAAALLLVLLIAGALSLFRPRIKSLAVLPFKNLTGDPGQEYFADGITDGLIMHLGRIGALRVISFYTVINLKNEKRSLAEITRDLRADVLVEGTIQQAGTSMGMRVRLIKALPEERNLWEGTYDRTITDVLSMYSDVARAIGQEIKVKLKPQEETRLASARQVNPETYKSYLKGMSLINGSTDEEFNQGLKVLQEAVEKDPTDPLVYLGLAEAYVYLGHSPASPPDAWQQARAAAERALKLDPNLAEAIADLADVKLYYERDWKGAEQYFLRAMELNPSLPWNHYHYAWYLALFGRSDEAIKEHKRAQELDPLTPIHTGWLGGLYCGAGQYDKAIAEAQKCIRMKNEYGLGWLIMGKGYAGKGMYKEAIAAHLKAVEINPSWKYALGQTYALAGQNDEARKILAELLKEPPSAFNAHSLAVLYAALGDRDNAFKWLAYEPSHAWTPWFRVDPFFFALRSDPRFKEMLRKFNLPPV